MDVRNIRNSIEIAIANNNGKVDQATVDDLVSQAKTPEDKKMLLDEFSRDAFDRSVDTSKVAKSLGAKSLDKPQISGSLGTNGSGDAVMVTHDFSPKGGFDNYPQAVGAARLWGNNNTAVVEKGGHYYAVETNIPAKDVRAAGKDAPKVMSAGGDLSQYQQKLDAAKSGGKEQWKDLAAYTYGVPPDQINVIADGDVEKAGGKLPTQAPPMINIYIGKELKGDESGVTGPIGDGKGDVIVNGAPRAQSIVVDRQAFAKDPAEAQKVLFHEGTHLEHNDQLMDLYAKYQKDPASKGGKVPFAGWISQQKLDPSQKQLMMDLAQGRTDDTEALAHVESFIGSYNKWTPSPNGADPRASGRNSDLLHLPSSPDKAVAKRAQDELMKFYGSQPPSTQRQIRADLNAMKGVEGAGWLLQQGPVADMLKGPEPKGW